MEVNRRGEAPIWFKIMGYNPKEINSLEAIQEKVIC
jgi:hypothetical protein